MPDKDRRGWISGEWDLISADPYVDPSRLGNELEEDVGAIDPQLVGEDGSDRDGFDREQRRFLKEPDSGREEAIPRGGALESLTLEFGEDGLDSGALEIGDSLDLEVFR